MASRWVTHDELVRGHVFYMWLANLYMFGFARPIIDHLVDKHGLTVSQVVNHFIDFISTTKQHSWLQDINQLYFEFWSCWVQNKPTPTLSIFGDKNVDFWYPYTFMASLLQKDHDKLMLALEDFVKKFNVTEEERDRCIWKTKHGTLRFSINYPYQDNGFEINSKKPVPNFDSLYEFCRYYYWWNRKKGQTLTNFKPTLP